MPFFGRQKGELNEEGIVEFDVPLGLLPTVFPPGSGERERAPGPANRALMGAGEKGERMVKTTSFFGGDIDGDGRALPFERELVDRGNPGDRRSFKIGGDRRERDDVGTMGVELVRDAEAVGTNDAGEAAEGVGEFIGILEAALKELVLGMTG